jgi:hypothetical protein
MGILFIHPASNAGKGKASSLALLTPDLFQARKSG